MENRSLPAISIPLFVIICLFAMSSWVDINGLWVEMPLMVEVLPEGWNLPSYLVVIVQMANIGPLIFALIKKLKPNLIKEWIAICTIIGIGIAACIFLVFFWSETSYIGGVEHSTALFSLSFFLAFVDCSSSVVYLPYMAQYNSPTYLTAFYVGGGLSGLVPAIVGLIQGVETQHDQQGGGGNQTSFNETEKSVSSPRFSVSVFYAILAGLLCISMLSFLFLYFHPHFKTFRSSTTASEKQQNGKINDSCKDEVEIFYIHDHPDVNLSGRLHKNSFNLVEQKQVSRKKRALLETVLLLFIVVWVNGITNGVMPSVQSFSCLPYGFLAYSLAVKLSILANPLACLLTLVVSVKRLSIILALTLLGSLCAAYQLYLAALSPHPILKDQTIGIVLVVTTSVLLVALFSYVRVVVATALSDIGGEKMLLYCGIGTQAGALIGAVIAFVLVNVYRIFDSE